jgi:hypothetical protein
MKISCPNCSRTIPAADVALDKGWAKCTACDEVFRLADLVEGYPAEERLEVICERPFDARVVLKRDGEQLTIHVPPLGVGLPAVGLLAFAVFWLGFIAFWTMGALGLIFGRGNVNAGNIAFAAFSIPFWVVGVGLLGGVVWLTRGKKYVLIDPGMMVTETRCLAWHRTRQVGRDQVQCAREYESVIRNENTTTRRLAVELVYRGGVYRIPAVNAAEQAWLVAEINSFLQAVPFDARRSPGSGFGWVSREVSRNESSR